MLVLVACKGNPAFTQAGNKLLSVNTDSRATAVAVARLWATTAFEEVVRRHYPIKITLLCDTDEQDGHALAKRP